jgi:hypothetical protein
MRKLGLALVLFLGLAPAQAQNAGWPPPAGAVAFLCVYNTALPTLTNGQDGFVQCDSHGQLLLTFSPSGTQNVNVTQFGSNPVVTGTGAGGNGIPRVTISNDSSLAANQSVNTAQVNGVTVSTGTGATGTGAQRVTVATDQATNAGAALVKGGVGVVNGGSTYQAVAASQTATVLQTATGAIGDYLSHCVIYPTSTSPGVVTVFDNANAAATNAIAFPGGASSTSNLVPIAVPVGAVSTAGAWKVTTGANVSVVCYGKFS